MTRSIRAFAGALLSIVAIVPLTLHADSVQLTLRDGRVSLVATNATPAQIFDAWSRAGGVRIVNADRMPTAPITLTLENVPEEQALETLLRPVSGYLARRRTAPRSDTTSSAFDQIVILATPPAPTTAVVPPPARGTPAAGAVFPQPARPVVIQPPSTPAAPAGIPQGPGVTRLVGPDGQPVEDDQAGAPPVPYTPGDAPDPRGPIAPPRPSPRPVSPAPPPPPATPPTSAPAGVPRPGMVVPAPQPQQPQPR